MANRQALGRGLDDLLQETLGDRRSLPVERIEPNPQQPRQALDREDLEGLAASIRRHGVLQPLIVSRHPERAGLYVLVAGERRWRAAQMADVREVPVTIVTADQRRQLELALVENLQRIGLAPLERARAYRVMLEEFGLTQTELAETVGMSRPAVANTLRILDLDAESQGQLANGRISEGHARALLSVAEGRLRQRLLLEIVAQSLSVRAAERRARALGGRGGEAPIVRLPERLDVELRHLTRRLQRTLGTRVNVRGTREKGRLMIDYSSTEELDALAERLLSE